MIPNELSEAYSEVLSLLADEISTPAFIHKIASLFRSSEVQTIHQLTPEHVLKVVEHVSKQIPTLLVPQLAAGIAALKQKGPSATPAEKPILRTKEEYCAYAREFVTKDLQLFFEPDDPYVQEIAEKAALLADQITEEFEVGYEWVPELVKLTLYDFIIFCDNSGSMSSEHRMKALKDTLQRMASIASKLDPNHGISLRFINHSNDSDGRFDSLKSPEEVMKKVSNIYPAGSTNIGTVLQSKIVKPLIIDKAEAMTLQRPVIVTIITDGEPYPEDRTVLRDTIRSCKRCPELEPYGKAVAVFVISRVGSNKKAEEYVSELGEDNEIKDMVFCNPERLDQKLSRLEITNNKKYTGYLLQMLAAALGGQATN